jgi:hypothetical protein
MESSTSLGRGVVEKWDRRCIAESFNWRYVHMDIQTAAGWLFCKRNYWHMGLGVWFLFFQGSANKDRSKTRRGERGVLEVIIS